MFQLSGFYCRRSGAQAIYYIDSGFCVPFSGGPFSNCAGDLQKANLMARIQEPKHYLCYFGAPYHNYSILAPKPYSNYSGPCINDFALQPHGLKAKAVSQDSQNHRLLYKLQRLKLQLSFGGGCKRRTPKPAPISQTLNPQSPKHPKLQNPKPYLNQE